MSINVRRLVPTLFMSLLLVGGAAMPTLAAAPENNVTVGSIASVAARAKPSVVGILNNMKASRSTDMGHAAGTGFVYQDGIIITNAHVVQNAAELKILFADETVETVLPSAGRTLPSSRWSRRGSCPRSSATPTTCRSASR
jgi:S1-C subfamily serine protease